jgi:hypothetical protein
MDDPAETRLPRIAPLLLLGVVVSLAVIRPGNLDGPDPAYRLFTSLTAVAAAAYVAWRFHGLIPAAAAILLLLIADRDASPDTVAGRIADTGLLTALAIGIAACSRQGRQGKLPWVIMGVAMAIPLYAWLGPDAVPATDAVVQARLQIVMLALGFLATPVALCARKAPWGDRLRLVGLLIGLPVVAALAVRLIRGEWPLGADGDWPAIGSEWRAAIRDDTWHHAAWCWTTPWVASPLIAVGLWRTIVRGWKSLKKGRPPLAWLITAVGIGTILAVGARPVGSSSFALAAVGSLLSVFGVADLVLALVERIELKPPGAP